MIVGLSRHPAGECFREIDDALVAMGRGDVVLNGHAAPDEIPKGATVWNFENVPERPSPGTSLENDGIPWCFGKRVWDFSRRNVERWKAWGIEATHVPVGYHRSMKLFERVRPTIHVAFMGCLNERRSRVFDALSRRGYQVALIQPGVYSEDRDYHLARAKLVVVPLYYPDGVFCSLRAAHLVANGVPVIVENCPEAWPFLSREPYEDLVAAADSWLQPEASVMREDMAAEALAIFKGHPLVLP